MPLAISAIKAGSPEGRGRRRWFTLIFPVPMGLEQVHETADVTLWLPAETAGPASALKRRGCVVGGILPVKNMSWVTPLHQQ